MTQVLHVYNTDERITYSSDWKTMANSGVGQNDSYSITSYSDAKLLLLFRGKVHT